MGGAWWAQWCSVCHHTDSNPRLWKVMQQKKACSLSKLQWMYKCGTNCFSDQEVSFFSQIETTTSYLAKRKRVWIRVFVEDQYTVCTYMPQCLHMHMEAVIKLDKCFCLHESSIISLGL